jgi:hypothetical protein
VHCVTVTVRNPKDYLPTIAALLVLEKKLQTLLEDPLKTSEPKKAGQ